MSKKIEAELVIQGSEIGNNELIAFLQKEVADRAYQRISACAAYASYRGILLVRAILSNTAGARYRWLIGLDDYLTDPKALELAMHSVGGETRLINLGPERRFHPKAYLLDLNEENTATLVVGSCNLTESALTKNCEVYVITHAKTTAQVKLVRNYWERLWRAGKIATEEAVSQYDKERRQLRIRHPVIRKEADTKKAQPHILTAIKDSVSTSSLVWIELGRNTGGGNQLDIVKNLAPFLGLPDSPQDGETHNLTIKSSLNVKNYQLTFTKGMWRFMGLQKGFKRRLRPSADKPSPYVLVIERKKKESRLTMRIMVKASPETRQMINISKRSGFLYRSILGPGGRRYGWY